MTLVCIIPGPKHEYARNHAGDRWCFGCRKRLAHDWVLLGDAPDVESYYEPIWVLKCSRCHKDMTRFPGTES
jgi:hypothetical protein